MQVKCPLSRQVARMAAARVFSLLRLGGCRRTPCPGGGAASAWVWRAEFDVDPDLAARGIVARAFAGLIAPPLAVVRAEAVGPTGAGQASPLHFAPVPTAAPHAAATEMAVVKVRVMVMVMVRVPTAS